MLPVVVLSALVLVPAATLMVAVLLQPRVPLYQFRVQKLPWFSLFRGDDQHSLQTTLDAQVIMKNDNFVSTAIHAIAFDLYYPTWDGTLHNIGHVVDKQQIVVGEVESDTKTTADTTTDTAQKQDALWVMQARKAFETRDSVHLKLWIRKLWRTFTHLIYQAIRRGGSLAVPSTGVVHVKAAGSTKLTLSMICDNSLNAFTMAMEGKECTMHKLTRGWVDLHEEAERMRQHIMSNMESKDGEVLWSSLKHHKTKSAEAATKEVHHEEGLRIEQHPALLLI